MHRSPQNASSPTKAQDARVLLAIQYNLYSYQKYDKYMHMNMNMMYSSKVLSNNNMKPGFGQRSIREPPRRVVVFPRFSSSADGNDGRRAHGGAG